MVEKADDNFCILCKEIIPEKTKPEHVLLNALGGRLTARKIICPDCNNEMGGGPDSDLAESTTFMRNICELKAGDGDDPPQLRALESAGERFDLKLGMKPQIRPRRPMEVDINDDGIEVKIEAYSDAEADKLAEGAAKKIAKHFGKNAPEAIAAIKQDILKARKSTFRPAPAIHQQLQFGTGRSKEAMAKACMVLWAMEVTNGEVNADRYDIIRAFTKTGRKDTDPENLVKIDTRSLPPLSTEYGDNPNIVWAGSDAEGRVYGYYRLFGAIGWRFLLCEQGAPQSQQVLLISNPFDPAKWKRLRNAECPINYDWVGAEWNSWPPEFEKVQARIEKMAAYAHELSQANFARELVAEGLQKAGCLEGDIITEEHIRSLSEYMTRPLLASILRKDIPED